MKPGLEKPGELMAEKRFAKSISRLLNNSVLKRYMTFLTSAVLMIYFIPAAEIHGESGMVTWLTPPELSYGRDFSEGLAVVNNNGRYGFINDRGDVVIDFQYDSAQDFSEGLATVQINNTSGAINSRGVIVFKSEFEWIGRFSEGLASVKSGKLYGFIGKDGKIAIKPRFENTKPFSSGFASVQSNGRWYRINRDGAVVEKPRGLAVDPRDLGFDEKYGVSFHDERAMVSKKSMYGFIDTDGKLAVPLKYYRVSNFSEGLASVQTYGTTGYINSKGELVIAEQFYEGADFSEGVARVVLDGNLKKWGFINKKGELVIDASGFDLVNRNVIEDNRNFSEGLYPVRRNGLWGYIDRKGKTVIEPQFEDAKRFSEGFAVVKKGGKYGYIKNPLMLNDTIESFSQGGQLVGEIKTVSGNDIIISGTEIGRKVFIGDKLCVSAGGGLILLSSTFPMMTTAKCAVISGDKTLLRKGLKVYKYKKRKSDDK